MPVNIQLNAFSSTQYLDQALSGFVAEKLRQGITERGAASLAVSGGRTPAGFFQALSQAGLDWSRVTITLVDERCVEEESPYSNTRSVRTHLLQANAAAACFLPLYLPGDKSNDANKRLSCLPDRFDAVVLGMGEDGHTASIFPNSPQREAALHHPAAALLVEGEAPVRHRITLSARRLLATRQLILHITGENKWQILGRALNAPDPVLPISHFLHIKGIEKHVFWTR